LAISPVVEVEGKRLSLSNLDKVLYPATGFTKGQVIDYYARIAPALLPHLKGRPVTMKRYPDGVDSEYFYEKNAPKHRPDWVQTAPVWSRHNRRHINFLLVDDLPTLTWLANLASLEIHPSLALAKDINCPTMMVFDLDPGPPANIVQCCQVGLWLREIFEHWGLECFPKTSGSKGMQIYVPLNTPTTYEVTKPFANALARLLEHDHPELVVSDMKKEVRAGKVFVDWSQNDEHKTTVSVYSLRARERPTVSTPVSWEEVEKALKKKDAGLLVFEAPKVVERFEKLGDLHAPVLELKQKLPDLRVAVAAPQPATVDLAAQAEEVAGRPARRAKKSTGATKSVAAKKTVAAKTAGRKRRAVYSVNSVRAVWENDALGGQERPSNTFINGETVCRHIGMGVSELEARFLSAETGAGEIPEPLHDAVECGGSELHVSSAGERDDSGEVDGG
jgi:bifunctional non-homologous end joining protein LigD